MTQLTIFDMLPAERPAFQLFDNPFPFHNVKVGDYAVITAPNLPGIGYTYYDRIKVLELMDGMVRGVFTNPWAEHYLDGTEVVVSKTDIRKQPDYYKNSNRT